MYFYQELPRCQGLFQQLWTQQWTKEISNQLLWQGILERGREGCRIVSPTDQAFIQPVL